MTVEELYFILEDVDNETVVEFSFKIPGRYPDDSDRYFQKVESAVINKARNTLVLE